MSGSAAQLWTGSRPGGRTPRLRSLLSLSPRQARFAVRGFAPCDPPRRQALEAIGTTFIGGYNAGLHADDPAELIEHLESLGPELRGFAAEGCAMGTAIADALPFRRQRLPHLLSLYEAEFTYLLHVGVGWALARVPWRRRHLLAPLDPVHGWLAFDGLGFHDGYFLHPRVLGGWRRERRGYAARSYDQGVGRALWFVCGGSVARAAAAAERLEGGRQGDLWSGLGLAMAYAGPAAEADVAEGLQLAGRHRPRFLQGIAFACEARSRAGHVPGHTRSAARAIGSEPQALAGLVRAARERLRPSGDGQPPYEVWRRSVAAALARGRGAAT